MGKVSLKDLCRMRRTAAAVFACGLLRTFPDVQSIEARETQGGFSYDFTLQIPFQYEFLHVIEHSMRALIAQETAIECIEMAPQNASELFASRHQPYLAQKAASFEAPLVSLVRIGEFVDLAAAPFLENTKQCAHFKLISFTMVGAVVRVFGVVHPDLSQLKGLAKRKKIRAQEGRSDLCAPVPNDSGCYMVQPAGVQAWHLLKTLWTQEGFQEVISYAETKEERWERMGSQKGERFVEWSVAQAIREPSYDGMKTPKIFTTDTTVIFCKKEELIEACFSCLQWIIKILKMLTFEYKIVLHRASSKKNPEPLLTALEQGGWEYDEISETSLGPRITFHGVDRDGRYWQLSSLESLCCRKGREKAYGVSCSVFDRLERIFALLQEKMLIVDKEVMTYAQHIEKSL